MSKLAAFAINNYWLLLVILGITCMLGFKDWTGILILLVVFQFFLAIPKIKYRGLDYLVILWFAYSLLSALWADNMILVYYGTKAEIIPIMFYFIARNTRFTDEVMLERMRWPLIFSYVAALYLYFSPPGWYWAYKTASIAADASDQAIYEGTRLSGFWPWSYFIGYSSLMYIMYEMKLFVFDRKPFKYFTLAIILSVTCLFLAQQRVSIAFLLVYMVLITFYARKANRDSYEKLIRIFIILALAILVLVFLFAFYVDSGYLEYILNRSSGYEGNLVKDRFDLFASFMKNLSLTGTGLGSCGHSVIYITGKASVCDNDYYRIIVEYGYIGIVLIMSTIACFLLKGFKNISRNFFYVNILLFLLCSMIGACPLELSTLQPFMYWYAMGKIMCNR